MLKKILTSLIILVATGAVAPAANPTFDELNAKALRFIAHGEWLSAQAMLQLMNKERPADASVCGRAIAVAGMTRDSVEQQRLLRSALESRLPFDSVFSAVEKESLAIGHADIYERFLKSTAANEPWLARTVDSYLLKYYSFRRYPDGMIELSRKMLQGLPDDTMFLHILADGYLLRGDYIDAVETLDHILRVDPRDYRALLQLGNYYLLSDEEEKGLDYLRRAEAICPTPRLRSLTELPLEKH